MKAVVSLSGGLDSTVALSMAHTRYSPNEIYGVSFSYGQRHMKELEAAERVSSFYGIPWEVISIPKDLFHGSNSTLIDPNEQMPHLTYKEISETPGVSPTYVPFRNAIFLSMLTARALILGAEEVWIGTHAEDARNWAYPDCTPEFNGAMANAIYVGTYMKVRLVTPLQWMMKSQVVGRGLVNQAPFHLTWSCYEGGIRACGKCPTCVERLQAFEENFSEDPIIYEES
jgi:7-cyano-7-deazaguanine synthase